MSVAAGQAQTPQPGTCEYGSATGSLDANDVRATLFNNGSLFRDKTFNGGGAQYYVPKDSISCAYFIGCRPPSPIFSASLWVAGRVDDELRAAGGDYSDFQFWPGPLGDDGRPVDPADCSAYDRIFVVSRADIARYLRTGEATDDLRDWPAALGAPVLDGDGVAGNYDLAAGDQPAILGDETAWWVMNDVGNAHRFSSPLGIEARVEAFAKSLPNPSSGLRAVDQATFFRYRLTYQGDALLDSAYVSVFVDAALGDCRRRLYGERHDAEPRIRLQRAGYTDEVYGVPPPAAGVAVIQGPKVLTDGRNNDGGGEIDESE